MPEVCESGIIEASAEKVWSVLRDFSGASNWAPNMVSSALERGQAADQVGAVRRLVFESGAEVLETLIALSDHERYFRYAMPSTGSMPISEYHGRVRVIPVTDSDRALVEWSGNFAVREGSADDVCAWVRGVYKSGIAGMRTYIEQLPA